MDQCFSRRNGSGKAKETVSLPKPAVSCPNDDFSAAGTLHNIEDNVTWLVDRLRSGPDEQAVPMRAANEMQETVTGMQNDMQRMTLDVQNLSDAVTDMRRLVEHVCQQQQATQKEVQAERDDTIQTLKRFLQEHSVEARQKEYCYFQQLLQIQNKNMGDLSTKCDRLIASQQRRGICGGRVMSGSKPGQRQEGAKAILRQEEAPSLSQMAAQDTTESYELASLEASSNLSLIEIEVSSHDVDDPRSPDGRSATSRNNLEMPKRALVINFRRLLTMHRVFGLLHELIKSTAIAALTLVAADSFRQGVYTLVFMCLVFPLYARHEAVNDGLEVDDVKKLMHFMQKDDQGRLLKSVSMYSRRFTAVFGWLVFLSVTGFLILSLCSLLALEPFEFEHMNVLSVEMEDAGTLGMQTIILGIMAILEAMFEYVLYRERKMVFPSGWDPRQDGSSPHGGWFGLPSMWLTSEAAPFLEDCFAYGQGKSFDLAELAVYAMEGLDAQEELEKALNSHHGIQLRFFDSHGRDYRDDKETDPYEHPGQLRCLSQRPLPDHSSI